MGPPAWLRAGTDARARPCDAYTTRPPAGRTTALQAPGHLERASARRRHARVDWGRARDGPARIDVDDDFRGRDAREFPRPAAATRARRGGASERSPDGHGDLKPWMARGTVSCELYSACRNTSRRPGRRVRTGTASQRFHRGNWQWWGESARGRAEPGTVTGETGNPLPRDPLEVLVAR